MVTAKRKQKIEIYFDLETGSYGDASNIIIIDVTHWDKEILESFYELSDGERIEMVLDTLNEEGENNE